MGHKKERTSGQSKTNAERHGKQNIIITFWVLGKTCAETRYWTCVRHENFEKVWYVGEGAGCTCACRKRRSCWGWKPVGSENVLLISR